MSKLPFEGIEREILVKKEAKSNFGINPEERPTEEIINYGIFKLNKPPGVTSHQASDHVKKILKINKAGHSGTLDPNVTGVLIVSLGRATRISQLLLPAGKEYVGLMHIHKKVDEKQLKEVLNKFVGVIKQKPPLKSAVRRIERQRKIYYLDILEIKGQDILFRVGCQAGTYIRKLCHDIGKKLGAGAHMQQLRRTKVGPFGEDNLFTLQDLADAYYYFKNEDNDKFIRKIINPVESALTHLPKIWILDSTIPTLLHGVDLKIPGISKLNNFNKDEPVAVMSLKGELVAIGTATMTSKEVMEKGKGLVVNIHKVFMKEN